MTWENRLPGGMSYGRRSGHQLRFTDSFPVDEDGLSPMRCPQDEHHVFKMLIASGDADGDAGDDGAVEDDVDRLYSSDDRHEFMPEHLGLATNAMEAAAEQMIHEELNKMFGKAFGGSGSRSSSGFGISMSYTPGSAPPVRKLQQLRIEETRRTVTCSSCAAMFAVYGIARYCPSCGQLGSTDAFTEDLDKLCRSLSP